MNASKFVFIIILFLSGILQSVAQRAVGDWQDYLSFSKAIKVADAGDRIYCATEGGLFYYNLEDNSTNKFSGVNSLSDIGINTISYNSIQNLLLVAYKNSNIDLIYESQIINLSDIKRKTITGDKTINNILFVDDLVYLSCGFGIVVINLTKLEIKDTYFIGENGGMATVYDMEYDGQYLYAATDNGILYADKNEPNLLDYNNWHLLEDIPHSTGKFTNLEIFTDKLIANYIPGSGIENEFYIRNGSTWDTYVSEVFSGENMQTNGNYLTINSSSEIYIINSSHSVVTKIKNYIFSESEESASPNNALFSESAGLFIADNNLGLIKAVDQSFEIIKPQGPFNNDAFSLYTTQNELWVCAGGRSSSWGNLYKAPQLQHLKDNNWTSFSKKEYPEMTGFHDIVTVVANPLDPGHIFAGSWGGGIIEFKNGEFIERYSTHNSSLQSAIPDQPDEPYTRIGGLAFDSQGNLWVTNTQVPKVLSVKKTSGQWEAFELPEIANSFNLGNIIVTQNDDKWLVVRQNGLYVVNNDNTQKKQLVVKSYFSNGTDEVIVDMNDVYCIAEDLDGAIWLGTSKGVAVYNNPQQVWNQGFLYASHPGLDINDGAYHPLLETETITAIAIDGANRKWMGTQNSGVYLISDNGEKEINHFTTENSPLLSNKITSIAINGNSGEVFFGTEDGIISYQGEAQKGNNDFSEAYVYPNPVRETYDGPVIISGLLNETDVKITDISGNLVFQTTSLGGQANWDGKNLNGNRVKTGVYLILLTDQEGEKTHILKLLFIH